MKPRRIDDLGRILISKELRARLGWQLGSSLDFVIEGNTLVLRLSQRKQTTTATQNGGKPLAKSNIIPMSTPGS